MQYAKCRNQAHLQKIKPPPSGTALFFWKYNPLAHCYGVAGKRLYTVLRCAQLLRKRCTKVQLATTWRGFSRALAVATKEATDTGSKNKVSEWLAQQRRDAEAAAEPPEPEQNK